MARTLNAFRLASSLLLAAVSSAFAQGLTDPTRPPAATGTAASEGGEVASGLQTIIRRAGAKPAAVINGQYVELGGRVGESRLVKVGEDSVVLQGPAGKEEMKLLPGIEKKPAVRAKPRKAGKAKAGNTGEATK
jgi:MSHA biogenesis protein MshK